MSLIWLKLKSRLKWKLNLELFLSERRNIRASPSWAWENNEILFYAIKK